MCYSARRHWRLGRVGCGASGVRHRGRSVFCGLGCLLQVGVGVEVIEFEVVLGKYVPHGLGEDLFLVGVLRELGPGRALL